MRAGLEVLGGVVRGITFRVTGEVLKSGEFEGVKFKVLTEVGADGKVYRKELEEGDTYLAARNTGPHLLTVKEVAMGAAFPVETAYPFDLNECVPIELIFED